MLLQTRGPRADETSGEASQTARRGLGQRELEERSLEAEAGGRSGGTQLKGRREGKEPRGSGGVGSFCETDSTLGLVIEGRRTML